MYWLLIIGLIIVLIVIHNKLFPPESQNRQNDRYLRKRKPAKFDSRCSSRAAHTLQSWSQTKQSSGKSVSANSAKNKKQPYSLYEDPYALKITIRLPSKASAKAPSDKPTIFRPQQNTTVAEHKPHQPATNNVHQLPTGPAARQQQTIQPQPAKPKYYSPVPEDIVQPQRTQHDELEQRKPDWYAIKMVLDMHDIHYLYHFTDRRNIPSIKRHGGLLSWYYCLTHNIVIPNPGGTEISRRLDERYDLEDYVRLSFCSDHPMAYGLKISGAEVVVLQIIADVALLKDTMFSDINATDSRHHHGGTLADLNRVDFEAVKKHYVSRTSPYFKTHQAEVMVKTCVPARYIVNLDDF